LLHHIQRSADEDVAEPLRRRREALNARIDREGEEAPEEEVPEEENNLIIILLFQQQ